MTTPIKWGSEFLVPTTTAGDQLGSTISVRPDGRFFVVWADLSKTGGDTSGAAIRGQYFDADGSKSGDEILINEYTTGNQQAPSLAALPDGRVMVTWQSQSFSGDDNAAIVGSSLDGNNGDFLINTTTTGSQTDPAVAAFGSGKFVVTWTDNDNIKAQILNPTGVKDGGEILVNSITAGPHSRSSVATFGNGNFVVAWQDSGSSSDDPSGCVRARLFSSAGAPLGPEFLVNTTIPSTQTGPTVTVLAGGRFVVTWTDFSQTGDDTSGSAVRAQIFESDGSRAGGEFLVHATTSGNQHGNVLAALPDGRFVVIWQDGTGVAADVRGQVFTREGVKSGSEFIVDTQNGLEQSGPAIAVLADGRFVVSFTQKSSDTDVRAQIFDPRESGVDISGTNFTDRYIGTSFDDTMRGYLGKDFLFGGEGNDVLDGGGGEDELHGGTGNDIASYLYSTAAVSIDLSTGNADGGDALGDILTGIESLYGSSHADVLIGDAADNSLWGFDGSDRIDGREGNDTIHGGAGADILIGGAGIDTAHYEGSPAGVDVDLSTGLGAGGDAAGDNLSGIENLSGTQYADRLHGDDGDNVLNGRAGNDVLKGGGGNDILIGGSGTDRYDGGDGYDTAVFGDSFDQFQVYAAEGGVIVMSTATSTEYLLGIERLTFDGRPMELEDGVAQFDKLYYLSNNHDVYYADVDAFTHYNEFGWREGRDPNAFFDTSGYLAVNRDVAAAGINPLDHYHQSGWRDGRDPHAWFDTTLYLINNPDVAAAGIDPLAHYLTAGMAEGRSTYLAVGQTVNGFDAQYYLFHNPDVAAAGVDPLQHFNTYGWREGRDPNTWFDTAGYLAHYTDVAAAGINPLDHYMTTGWREGRDAASWFDTRGYLAANPDVAAAGMNPLEHFLQFGVYEGRQAVNDGVWF